MKRFDLRNFCLTHSLCGQSFGFGILLNMTHKQTCLDCKKPVCSHCCVEITSSLAKKYKPSCRCHFLSKGDCFLNIFRSICLCHVCSEIRDVYKKTGAWFYGLPNYELPTSHSSNRELNNDGGVKQPIKVTKTTKLGMEIDSDDDDEETDVLKDVQNLKNGSFSSNFLKSRNLFNLRLSTEPASRFAFDSTSPLPKKSPNTPYSRQTSSSDSQKSANSLQPQANEWESGTPNGCTHRQRRNSISSCVSESASAAETFTMNQRESF